MSSWPQRTALAIAVVLLGWGLLDAVGVLGGAVLAVLHLTTGVLLGASTAGRRVLRRVAVLVGSAYLVVTAFGVSDRPYGLDAGPAGDVLHLLVGFAGVGLAVACAWSARRHRRLSRTDPG
ncbi:hypothetical protein GCM10022243_17800 [Saccharothrix violaceirubra]|uniref:DUF4383 domain-containing protein n=1 Tax=Saccharothrix violaceirubra TaxID=413306 RepID=A0A7W7WUM7_9PSEU|nr:hypothetical protein [Saccharothrix violaceirubra]MBB4964429.1 hypothetical protein [Saccharothrix violaceirubra]